MSYIRQITSGEFPMLITIVNANFAFLQNHTLKRFEPIFESRFDSGAPWYIMQKFCCFQIATLT